MKTKSIPSGPSVNPYQPEQVKLERHDTPPPPPPPSIKLESNTNIQVDEKPSVTARQPSDEEKAEMKVKEEEAKIYAELPLLHNGHGQSQWESDVSRVWEIGAGLS